MNNGYNYGVIGLKGGLGLKRANVWNGANVYGGKRLIGGYGINKGYAIRKPIYKLNINKRKVIAKRAKAIKAANLYR